MISAQKMGAGVMRDCLPHSLPHNFACAVPKNTSSEGKVPFSTLETEELAAVAHRSTLGECKLQTIATMSQQDGGSRDQQNAIESRFSSELMEARETYKAAKRQFKTRAGQRMVKIFMWRGCSIGVGRRDVLDSGCHVADRAQAEQGRGRAERCSCLGGCVLRIMLLELDERSPQRTFPEQDQNGTGTPL
jgi:hypothetical protein